ncbi:21228_t:CDS:1, partial [Gigaspora rosea]
LPTPKREYHKVFRGTNSTLCASAVLGVNRRIPVKLKKGEVENE